MKKLKEQLKTGKFDNSYFFCGEEEYLKRYYTNLLTDAVISKEHEEFNRMVLDVSELGTLQAAVESLPFMSDKKLVLVRAQDFSAQIKAEGVELVLQLLEDLPPYTVLVFSCKTIDKRSKIYKLFQKNTTVCEFVHQKPVDVINWMGNVLKKEGFEAGRAEVTYLFEHTGVDMTNATNEMQKLMAYCAKSRKIKKGDIDAVAVKTTEIKTFDMLDAALAGKAQQAFSMLKEMELRKEQSVMISGALAKHLSNLLFYRTLCAEGKPLGEIAERMKIAPFIVNKYKAQAPSRSIAKLKHLIKQTAEYDIGFKTGQIDGYVGLYALLAQVMDKEK